MGINGTRVDRPVFSARDDQTLFHLYPTSTLYHWPLLRFILYIYSEILSGFPVPLSEDSNLICRPRKQLFLLKPFWLYAFKPRLRTQTILVICKPGVRGRMNRSLDPRL